MNSTNQSAAHDLDAGNDIMRWLPDAEKKYITPAYIDDLKTKYNKNIQDRFQASHPCAEQVYNDLDNALGHFPEPYRAALAMRIQRRVLETHDDVVPGLRAARRLIDLFREDNESEEWFQAVSLFAEDLQRGLEQRPPSQVMDKLIDTLDESDADLRSAIALAGLCTMGANMNTHYIMRAISMLLQSPTERGLQFLYQFFMKDNDGIKDFFESYCGGAPYTKIARLDQGDHIYIKEKSMVKKRERFLKLLDMLESSFFSEGGKMHEEAAYLLSLIAQQGELYTGDHHEDHALWERMQQLDEDVEDIMSDLRSACRKLQGAMMAVGAGVR